VGPQGSGSDHAAQKSQVTVTAGCGMGVDGGLPDAKPDATMCPPLVDFSCVTACDSGQSSAPSCVDGDWTCPPGTFNNEKCTSCPVTPHGCCEDDGTFVTASCVNGDWTCPPGTALFGTPGCSAPEVCTATLPCPFNSYCDLPDDSCGKASLLGTCKPIPMGCPPDKPMVCGCNGTVYESLCAASAGGVDIDGNDGCDVPFGLFPCGGLFCKVGSEVCRQTTTLGAQVPDAYDCVLIPAGCGDGCSCKLCEVCPPNGPCGVCGPDGPEGGVYLQCTQLGN
jgi:hypothetical protein